MSTVEDAMNGDSVPALEYEWMLYAFDNDCANTSLDEKKNDTSQTYFTEFLEDFAYYSGTHSIQE